MKSRIFDYAGIFASVVLIAMGAGAVFMGLSGRSDVSTQLKREQISGTADMTPSAIQKEIAAAKLKNVPGVPTCSVANQLIDTGGEARCFAQYMRIHALEATGGRPYSQMGRYLTASGKETDDAAAAAKDPKTGQPTPNGARDIWVTETALSTALNTSDFAQQVALFAIVMGLALLFTGFGFGVFTVRHLKERTEESERPVASMKPAGVTA
jgi:hypothetical protein